MAGKAGVWVVKGWHNADEACDAFNAKHVTKQRWGGCVGGRGLHAGHGVQFAALPLSILRAWGACCCSGLLGVLF